MARKKITGRDIDLDREVVRDKRGRRITEADAERIAAETLAKVGRPSLSGARTSPQLSIRVSAETAAKLDARAAREGRSRSEVAREALERFVS